MQFLAVAAFYQTLIKLINHQQTVLLLSTLSLEKSCIPSLCIEGNVKEIVQYRVKFPSVSEKSTRNLALHCTFPSIGNLSFGPVCNNCFVYGSNFNLQN